MTKICILENGCTNLEEILSDWGFSDDDIKCGFLNTKCLKPPKVWHCEVDQNDLQVNTCLEKNWFCVLKP